MGPFRLLAVVTACCAAAAPAAQSGVDSYANLLAPAGACGAAADQLGLDAATARTTMLCLTNYARTQSGLAPLKANAVLDTAGATKLAADVDCNEFTHTPCGRPFQSVFAAYLAGANGYTVGENIAWGTGSYGTPRSTMDAWLNSTGHRENILNPAFAELGVGYLPNVAFQGNAGATLWSQEFGKRTPAATTAPRQTPPPSRRRAGTCSAPCRGSRRLRRAAGA